MKRPLMLRVLLLCGALTSSAQACQGIPLNLARLAIGEAVRAGLPPALQLALVCAESRFNPNAVSSAGAIGLGQLMPGTAAALGVVNPWNPQQNLNGSARYLRAQLVTFGGSLPLALAAYNAGPGAVRAAGGVPNFPETTAYVQRILTLAPLFEQVWRGWAGVPQPQVAVRPAAAPQTTAVRPRPALRPAPVVQAAAVPVRSPVNTAAVKATTAPADRTATSAPPVVTPPSSLTSQRPAVTALGMQLVRAARVTVTVPGVLVLASSAVADVTAPAGQP